MLIAPALERLGQLNHKFQDSLVFTGIACHKKTNKISSTTQNSSKVPHISEVKLEYITKVV